MRTKTIVVAVVAVALVIIALGGAWYLLERKPEAVCPFSGRGIHVQTRARVRIGGREYETCCVRCAIIEAQQTGKPLRVLEVGDFETGNLLIADRAWFVEGSAVNPCMSMAPKAGRGDQHTVCLLGFDRCSPSDLAFSSEGQARTFAVQHGGTLKHLSDLECEIRTETPGVKTP